MFQKFITVLFHICVFFKIYCFMFFSKASLDVIIHKDLISKTLSYSDQTQNDLDVNRSKV